MRDAASTRYSNRRYVLILVYFHPNSHANCSEGAVIVEPVDWSKGTAAMEIFEGLKKQLGPDEQHTSPVDFLMVVGDGRDDKVIFRWANDLGRDKIVENVTTVSLGSRNTEAGFTLTQGVTGMLIALFLWTKANELKAS